MSKKHGDPYERPVTSGLPLFETPEKHLSGKTDPQTSRDAARRVKTSGSLSNGQRLALKMIRVYPGRTCPELAVIRSTQTGEAEEWSRQAIGRRLNELEKAGLIRREGVRDGCACWWPV